MSSFYASEPSPQPLDIRGSPLVRRAANLQKGFKNAELSTNETFSFGEGGETGRKHKRLVPLSVAELMRNMPRRSPSITAADLTRIPDFPAVSALNESVLLSESVSKRTALFNNVDLKSAIEKDSVQDASSLSSNTASKLSIQQRRRKTMPISDYLGNINRLIRNKEALKNISPPSLCPGYPDLIDGFSPTRLQSLLSTPIATPSPSLPKASRSIKHVHRRISICAKEESSPRQPVALNQSLVSSPRKKAISFVPEASEWVLIVENPCVGAEKNAKLRRLLYNLEHLFHKYGLSRGQLERRKKKDRNSKDDVYAQRALAELLEICAYHMGQGQQRTFDVLSLVTGEVVKDIRLIPISSAILVVSPTSSPPVPLPQSLITRLEHQRAKALNIPESVPKFTIPTLSPPPAQSRQQRTFSMQESSLPMGKRQFGLPAAQGEGRYSPVVRARKSSMAATGRTPTQETEHSEAMNKSAKMVMEQMQAKYGFDKRVFYDLLTQFTSLMSVDRLSAGGEERKAEGELRVKKATFLMFAQFFKEKHPEVSQRILLAADVPSYTETLGLEDFVRLNMLLQYFRASKEDYVEFWLRYLDPARCGVLDNRAHYPLLEKLARGYYNKEETLISDSYAKGLETLMKQQGCLNSSGRLSTVRLGECLRSGLIEVKAFNKGLRLSI